MGCLDGRALQCGDGTVMTEYLLVDGHSLALDKNGYLRDMSQWTAEVATVIATKEGMMLTDDHWEVIYFVREFYETYDTSPAIRALVKAMQLKFGPEKGNSRYLHRLFPDGPAKLATKLAGLPKPAKCL